jgi:hypothetical protein
MLGKRSYKEFFMKNKITAVALIGLLFATGLILVGCNVRQCPGDGDCKANFTGTGSSVYVNSRTGCEDERCGVYKVTGATSGYNFDVNCNRCGI